MNARLRVQRFMSPAPYIVADTHTLDYAARLMEQHRIRHLPVLHSGRLVGVLSAEEARSAMARGQGARTSVREVMSLGAYAVAADAPLEDVAREMAEKKHALAVVVSHDNVIGVFTAVDGLRALAELSRDAANARPVSRATAVFTR